MRIRNKAMIYDLFFNDPYNMGVKLESECMADGAITFHVMGTLGLDKLYCVINGWMSYYEKEEIDGRPLNEVVEYIWKERKRFIDTRSET